MKNIPGKCQKETNKSSNGENETFDSLIMKEVVLWFALVSMLIQTVSGCVSNEDCLGLSVEGIPLSQCHPKYEICVNCISDEECQRPDGNNVSYCKSRCIEGFCLMNNEHRCFGVEICYGDTCVECYDPSHCSLPSRRYCNLETMSCVQCIGHEDCEETEVCENNICVEIPDIPGLEPEYPPSDLPPSDLPPSYNPGEPPYNCDNDKNVSFSLCYTYLVVIP